MVKYFDYVSIGWDPKMYVRNYTTHGTNKKISDLSFGSILMKEEEETQNFLINKRSFFKTSQFKIQVYTKYSTFLTLALYRHNFSSKSQDYSIALYLVKNKSIRCIFVPSSNSPIYIKDSCFKTDTEVPPGNHTFTVIVSHSDPYSVKKNSFFIFFFIYFLFYFIFYFIYFIFYFIFYFCEKDFEFTLQAYFGEKWLYVSEEDKVNCCRMTCEPIPKAFSDFIIKEKMFGNNYKFK